MKTRKRKAVSTRLGALMINPRRKPAKRRSAKRRSTKRRASVRRVRSNGLRAGRRRLGALRVNPLVRRNPRRKTRRAAPKVMRARKNPATKRRKATRKRRKNALKVNPYMRKLEKLPVVGPFLAASVGMVAPALVGAVSVEPQLLVNRGIARVAPGVPVSVAHAVSGLILGAATVAFLPGLSKMVSKKGIKKDTAKMLGAAMAAGGGAVGYFIMKTEQDAPVDDAMGALALRGVSFGNPIATVAQGLAGVGSLHGQTHSLPDYGSYGNAEAIYPANAAPQGIGRVISPTMSGNLR